MRQQWITGLAVALLLQCASVSWSQENPRPIPDPPATDAAPAELPAPTPVPPVTPASPPATPAAPNPVPSYPGSNSTREIFGEQYSPVLGILPFRFNYLVEGYPDESIARRHADVGPVRENVNWAAPLWQ